jgi:hypothetical protein
VIAANVSSPEQRTRGRGLWLKMGERESRTLILVMDVTLTHELCPDVLFLRGFWKGAEPVQRSMPLCGLARGAPLSATVTRKSNGPEVYAPAVLNRGEESPFHMNMGSAPYPLVFVRV